MKLSGVAVGCMMLVIGCGGDDEPAVTGAEAGPVVQLNDNASLIAAETPEEWVALSDYVAVVTIDDERIEQPSDPGAGQAEMGSSSYSVTVERIVWEDPENKAPAPGSTIEIFGAGWVFRPEDERPFFPHMEIGKSYLMPLGSFGDDGLGPLTFDSIVPIDEDGTLVDWTVRVAEDENQTLASVPGPVGERLPDDASVDDVKELLGSIEVPTEIRRASASPIDRYLALQDQAG